jgi:Bacterial extracellular solute-binding proteins, family 3
MGVNRGEVEPSGDEEEDGSHCLEAGVSTSLAFGSLKQGIDGFDIAIGLTGPGPRDDAIEMTVNHAGDILHGIDLGPQDVGAPLLEHGGDDIDLLAIKDVAQLLAIEPRARRAFGGELRNEPVEVGCLLMGELSSILEQRPAQPFEAGISLLLRASHLVDGLAGVSDDVELVEGDPGIRQIVCHAFEKGWRHVDADQFDAFRVGLVGTQIFGKAANGVSVVPFGDEYDPAAPSGAPPGQAMSRPYAAQLTRVVFRSDARPIVSIDDLKGRSIAVPPASFVHYLLDTRGIAVRTPYLAEADILSAVDSGAMEAGVVSEWSLGWYRKMHPQSHLEAFDQQIIDPALDFNVAIVLRNADQALLSRVNEIVGGLMDDGTMRRVFGNYGISYRLPLVR